MDALNHILSILDPAGKDLAVQLNAFALELGLSEMQATAALRWRRKGSTGTASRRLCDRARQGRIITPSRTGKNRRGALGCSRNNCFAVGDLCRRAQSSGFGSDQ